ncbi:hypothetical protein J1N35_035617 [Gossypium stocksii]|uniref:DUF4219 domain-containing protein n=1 Tax=Gossypium stocksii TaxID=47602 RepID=A0A9D3UU98_9ROSI|nr:hypothetical protein J1N35_035617 [Gossypium stocksii]
MGSSNLSVLAPPVFDGEKYQAWAVRMQAYMEGRDYWESVEEDYEMKESKPIKEYSNKLVDIANKVRVVGTDLSDSRLMLKILASILKKYEATIASLKNTKDLT